MLNFFEHLNPFYDSCFRQFSYTYWNTVLLMIMDKIEDIKVDLM